MNELEHLAYHEAGHAVMSYLLREGHTNKQTIPLDEFEKVAIQGEMQDWGKTTVSLDSWISAAQALLAGHISEKIKYGGLDDVLYGDSAQDLSAAKHLIASFIEEMTRDSEAVRKQTPKSLELHATLAETGLRCHWLAVEALAQALLKRKILTGKKAVKIIKVAIARQTHRVLIVDRNTGAGELVALVLKERKKSRTHIVPDGNIDLAAIAADPPDVVFIYWYAVEPDALAFCQQIKATPQTRSIPVIVWSGRVPDQELYLRLQRAGAAGHLALPCAPQEILAAHDAVLRGQTYYPPIHALN